MKSGVGVGKGSGGGCKWWGSQFPSIFLPAPRKLCLQSKLRLQDFEGANCIKLLLLLPPRYNWTSKGFGSGWYVLDHCARRPAEGWLNRRSLASSNNHVTVTGNFQNYSHLFVVQLIKFNLPNYETLYFVSEGLQCTANGISISKDLKGKISTKKSNLKFFI